MTPRTRTEPRSTPLRSPHQAIGIFLGAAVLAVLIVAPSLAPAKFVPRLTIENTTPFDVNVDVSTGGGKGWIQLGTVGREDGGVLEEVADVGATWVFRFSYGGFDAAELTVPRAALRASGWQLAVPPEAGERLTSAGFEASAR
jgi:hypothetical protein